MTTTRPDQKNRPTLLIVDDEPDVLDSLQHLFHRKFQIFRASSAREALAILESQPIQVILCDQRMPGTTGDELLSQVRARWPDTMRLLFTGYADIQAVTRAVNEGGIFRYILKPWDSSELESVLRQAVNQFELVAERRRLIAELELSNARLRDANRELEASNALKIAFLEVASHELKTPITIVSLLAELLLRQLPGDLPARASVQQILVSARQLDRRVSTMLELSQSRDFRNTLDLESTNLSLLLDQLADQLQPIIDSRNLVLRRELMPDLGDFLVDPDKLRDAIANLLSNAIRFTPDGGTIHLAACLRGPDEAEIRVADSGIGIEPNALQHMFDPFFTEFDPSNHSSGDYSFGSRGLGLGLSLVKTFVEMHGGTVGAESTSGEGTSVTIRIPRSPRPPGEPVVQSASHAEQAVPEHAGSSEPS
jgi:signal transduction histidine kinase